MRAHAVVRLGERYDVHRNGIGIVAALKARVLAGEAKFRGPLEAGRSEWEAYVARRRVRFVWSEVDRKVITVLPQRKRRRRHGDG